ncbi:putative nuclease HARBI1 [Haliotis asinina]|uniref:putative nuclease HARBI1 n=1 Tax=Haliotis asinina TaxID=109174 RepID=UPI003531A29E
MAAVLCEWIAPLLPERTLSAERKLLSTLWLLANQESYHGIADWFGKSKGSLHVIALSVCGAIASTVKEYIKLPTLNEVGAVAEGFSKWCGFPKVIGAIKDTQIPISGTSCNRDAFINRKGYSSMQLQVVCDAKLQFTDTYVGWPGSVHDCRIFKNSPLRHKLEQGYLPPDFHLIGDSGYSLAPYIMVPFKDKGHLSLAEKKFNKCHASTRVDVERARLLKRRFRRLMYLGMQLTEEMYNFIAAA